MASSRLSRWRRISPSTKWANADPVAGTAKARAAFLQSFIDQVDPDRVLPEAERLRRAESAKSAHFAKLRIKPGSRIWRGQPKNHPFQVIVEPQVASAAPEDESDTPPEPDPADG